MNALRFSGPMRGSQLRNRTAAGTAKRWRTRWSTDWSSTEVPIQMLAGNPLGNMSRFRRMNLAALAGRLVST